MTPLVDAWQSALTAEHAAVAGYDVAGPHLGSADAATARADQQAHRTVRDATSAALATAGQTPELARADYPLPFAVTSAATAQRLALSLESACAAAWRYVIALAGPADATLRAAAQANLTAAAIRALHWRRLVEPTKPTVPFPGI
jgi:hypothetical protein